VFFSSKARVLGSAGQISNWISDSCIIAKTSRNIGSVYTVQASAGRLVSGIFTRSLTHDAPLLSTVSVTNVPVTGSSSITVTGFNFGGFQNSLSITRIHKYNLRDFFWFASLPCFGSIRHISVSCNIIFKEANFAHFWFCFGLHFWFQRDIEIFSWTICLKFCFELLEFEGRLADAIIFVCFSRFVGSRNCECGIDWISICSYCCSWFRIRWYVWNVQN
jgi:hypothetical protein